MRDLFEGIGAIIVGFILIVGVIAGFIFLLGSVKFEAANQNVSGVVYNVKNENFISGNTTFSVRASEDTYVSEENKSSFCLPNGSPYIKVVNEAAENKNIKVSVKTTKFFRMFTLPWTCVDNVTVTKVGESK